MSASDNSHPDPHNSRRAFFTLFPAVALPIFLAMLVQTIMTTALPAIADQFGDAQNIAWVMISYLIALAIAAPVYGRLGDTFGRKRMLFFSLFAFCVASILCALSGSVWQLIVARLLQGLAGGGLLTLSQALIGETLTPRDRAKCQGYLATIAVTANAVGAVAGGYVSEYYGWKWIFLINIPLSLIAALLLLRLKVSHHENKPFRLDYIGLSLLIVFVSATLLIPQFHYQSTSEGVLFRALLVVVSVISAASLWQFERRSRFPLISISLISKAAAWRSLALAACQGATLFSLLTLLPIYMRVVHGSTIVEAGSMLLPFTIAIGVGSFATGWLVSRTGLTVVFPSVGLLCTTICLLLLAFCAGSMSDLWLAVLLAVAAASLGTVMGVVQITMQIVAGKDLLASAAGLVHLSRSIGAAVGISVVSGALFFAANYFGPDVWHALIESIEVGRTVDSHLRNTSTQVTHCFSAAFLATAIFPAVAFLLTFSLPIRRLSTS